MIRNIRCVSNISILAAALAAVCVCEVARSATGLHDQPISTRDLLSLKDVGGAYGTLVVSPDHRWVAFQIQMPDFDANTYSLEWYVAPLSGRGKPVDLGGGGDVMLAPAPFGRVNGARADMQAKWSPDGRWIAFLRKDKGEVQVWRSRTDGSGEQQVTHNAANVMSFDWRVDGRAIYFRVGRSRKEMARRDREEGERGYLLDDRFFPDYSTKPRWFPCGEGVWKVAPVKSERCTPTLWVAQFGTPERKASLAEIRAYRRAITPMRPTSIARSRAIQGMAWNAAHTQAAWLENLAPRSEPGFGAPLTLFAAGMRCTAPQCTGHLEDVWWSGPQVVYLRSEGWAYSVPAVYVWTPGKGEPRRIYREDSILRSCAVAGRRLVCLQETPTTPRKIVSIDLRDGRVTTIFDPNPGFARYRLGRVEKLDVTDGFGNEAFGHLVYPPDYHPGCRYPLVIVQYRSRGFLRGGTGDEYPIFPLAAAGFLVYSSDSPEDWRSDARYDSSRWQGIAQLAEHQVGPTGFRMRSGFNALQAAITRLERRGLVDPARIGITGLSAGAEVLYYALGHSREFAAAATSGLVSADLEPTIVNRTLRQLFESGWGATSMIAAILDADRIDSLTYNIDEVNAPLLIQASDHELIGTLPDFTALRAAGKPVEAYVFPDEYHVLWQPLHQLYASERNVDWFRFWLEGEEDPSPAKAQEYARWTAMRARDSFHPVSRAEQCAAAAGSGHLPGP